MGYPAARYILKNSSADSSSDDDSSGLERILIRQLLDEESDAETTDSEGGLPKKQEKPYVKPGYDNGSLDDGSIEGKTGPLIRKKEIFDSDSDSEVNPRLKSVLKYDNNQNIAETYIHTFRKNDNSTELKARALRKPSPNDFQDTKFNSTIDNNFFMFFIAFLKSFKTKVIYFSILNNFKSLNLNFIHFFKTDNSNFFYFLCMAPKSTIIGFLKNSKFTKKLSTTLRVTSGMPFFFFKDKIKKVIYNKIKKESITDYAFFYQHFLIKILELTLNYKIYFRMFSMLKLVHSFKKKKVINFLIAKYKYFINKIGKGFFLKETIEVL